MARLPSLAEALARHDDRAATMISHFSRVLRDADKIVSTQKGLGAARMDEDDATVLLMATLGSLTPAGGPDAVDRLRLLKPLLPSEPSFHLYSHPLADVWMRPFAEVLRYCIVHAPSLQKWESDYRAKRHGAGRDFVDDGLDGGATETRPFLISVYSSGALARIRMGLEPKEPDLFAQTYTEHGVPGVRLKDGVGVRSIGVPVLLALKEAVDTVPPPRSWGKARPN